MSLSTANISRVPLLLTSSSSLGNLTRTNLALFNVTNQLSSQHRVNRASDDSVAAATITVLDSRIAVSAQRQRSIQHAGGVLGTLDSALSEATDLVNDAASLASSQIGLTSDATTRSQQAQTVDSMIRRLYDLANRTHDGAPSGIHLFGGSASDRAPIVQTAGGYRYVGRGAGMLTDLGLSDAIPITIGADTALGETATRVRGTRDLNPDIGADTRLADLAGASGRGVRAGVVNFSFSGSTALGTIDLTGAQNIQDVIATATAAIRDYETGNGVTVLGPGGIYVAASGLGFDIAGSGALTFTDPTNGSTASDLGIAAAPLTGAAQTGLDLNPRVTWQTPISQLAGVSLPLGSIRARTTSGGVASIVDVDLSGAQTLGDLRSLVETNAPGLRVEINTAGTGINIVSDLAGPTLAIDEAPGGTNTATQLGIRSFDTTTRISDFNFGAGVRVVDGVVDPTTGLPSAALNRDLRITLGNGQYFDVDLRPADLVDVQSVLARVNAEFAAAVGSQNNGAAPALAAGQFSAGLNPNINGIAFTSSVPGAVGAAGLNNSAATEDLGLTALTLDAGSGAYVGADRASVRVNNLFSDLINLRDSLLRDDSSGITRAGEAMTRSAARLTSAHALIGTYAQRVDQAENRRAAQDVLDLQTKSTLQDVDFAAAATQYSQLQTTLQATLRIAGSQGATSLFDFLR
ncbi:hypothetical protein BH11PLA1_BH11PLA1_17260 [soil metagenome]